MAMFPMGRPPTDRSGSRPSSRGKTPRWLWWGPVWLPSGVIAILGVVGVMVFNLTGHSSWSLWVILGAVVLGALVYRR